MKIAHVNTYTYGGAAMVAKRIHQSLLNMQFDSLLITHLGVRGNISNHVFFKDGRIRNILLKIKSNPAAFSIFGFIKKRWKHPNLAERPEGFEIFSTINPTVNTNQFDILEDRDVIHLHWVNDFLEYESFFKRFSDKKFVWTLHDMNPITGGCHHSDGCMKFESMCSQCPQLKNTIDENYSKTIQETKTKALSALQDDQMIIVSPSHWLLDLSKKSTITKRFKHIHVPNPSFKNIETSGDRNHIRKKSGLPINKKIVMFASADLNNTRKGISILFEAMRLIPNKKDIVLLGVGHRAKHQEDFDVIFTGSISNTELLANYFQASDLFVTPTLAENSPLVVIESLCCGTPVVASNVGGIPDLINKDNGLLFPVGDSTALAKVLYSALFEKQFDRNKIRNDAQLLHSATKVAADYVSVYNSFYN